MLSHCSHLLQQWCWWCLAGGKAGQGGWAAGLRLVSNGVLASTQVVIAVAEVAQGGAGCPLKEVDAGGERRAGEGGETGDAETDEAAGRSHPGDKQTCRDEVPGMGDGSNMSFISSTQALVPQSSKQVDYDV